MPGLYASKTWSPNRSAAAPCDNHCVLQTIYYELTPPRRGGTGRSETWLHDACITFCSEPSFHTLLLPNLFTLCSSVFGSTKGAAYKASRHPVHAEQHQQLSCCMHPRQGHSSAHQPCFNYRLHFTTLHRLTKLPILCYSTFGSTQKGACLQC